MNSWRVSLRRFYFRFGDEDFAFNPGVPVFTGMGVDPSASMDIDGFLYI